MALALEPSDTVRLKPCQLNVVVSPDVLTLYCHLCSVYMRHTHMYVLIPCQLNAPCTRYTYIHTHIHAHARSLCSKVLHSEVIQPDSKHTQIKSVLALHSFSFLLDSYVM